MSASPFGRGGPRKAIETTSHAIDDHPAETAIAFVIMAVVIYAFWVGFESVIRRHDMPVLLAASSLVALALYATSESWRMVGRRRHTEVEWTPPARWVRDLMVSNPEIPAAARGKLALEISDTANPRDGMGALAFALNVYHATGSSVLLRRLARHARDGIAPSAFVREWRDHYPEVQVPAYGDAASPVDVVVAYWTILRSGRRPPDLADLRYLRGTAPELWAAILATESVQGVRMEGLALFLAATRIVKGETAYADALAQAERHLIGPA